MMRGVGAARLRARLNPHLEAAAKPRFILPAVLIAALIIFLVLLEIGASPTYSSNNANRVSNTAYGGTQRASGSSASIDINGLKSNLSNPADYSKTYTSPNSTVNVSISDHSSSSGSNTSNSSSSSVTVNTND